MAARNYAKGAIKYPFVPLPFDVLRSNEFRKLAASSKVLMLDLCAQYTGKNNGKLCPGFVVMQQCGWNSKAKLLRAKKHLLECSFAMQTRIGHPPETTEWLGFTWWRLDWHDTMEISAKAWPFLNFLPPILPALSVVPNRGRSTPKTALSRAPVFS